MNGQEDSAAVSYYSKIITPDDVLALKDLVRKIPRAPSRARQYLQKHCRVVQELEEFFKDNSHVFYLENGRVTLYNEELETAGDVAETYFKDVLERYEGPVHFMTLKKRHLGDAPDIVSTLITRFYPGKEFKHFLRSRPDVFVVDKDHRVFLIEVESVAFFEKRLEIFGREKYRFMDFKGHVAQAPPHVQEYINRNYPGTEFQRFLVKNSDVFHLSKEGYVSLVPLR